jgi:hypothetical protein
VISQLERLSSNETKIAPRSVWIAVNGLDLSAPTFMVSSKMDGSDPHFDAESPPNTSWDLEKALQVIARGDLARGGSMFRRHMQRQTINAAMQDETKTGRKRQPANTKKPRTRALQALIQEIMNHRRAMIRNQLLAELRKHEKGEVIYTINDAERIIEWEDKNGRVQSTQFSALKDRMNRARKNLRSLNG